MTNRHFCGNFVKWHSWMRSVGVGVKVLFQFWKGQFSLEEFPSFPSEFPSFPSNNTTFPGKKKTSPVTTWIVVFRGFLLKKPRCNCIPTASGIWAAFVLVITQKIEGWACWKEHCSGQAKFLCTKHRSMWQAWKAVESCQLWGGKVNLGPRWGCWSGILLMVDGNPGRENHRKDGYKTSTGDRRISEPSLPSTNMLTNQWLFAYEFREAWPSHRKNYLKLLIDQLMVILLVWGPVVWDSRDTPK